MRTTTPPSMPNVPERGVTESIVAVITGAVATSLVALVAVLIVLAGGHDTRATSAASKARSPERVRTFVRNHQDDHVPTSKVDGWRREHAGLYMLDGDDTFSANVVITKVDLGEHATDADLQRNARAVMEAGLRREGITATIDSVTPRSGTFGMEGGVVVRMHRMLDDVALDQQAYMAVDGTMLYMAIATTRRGDSVTQGRARDLVDVLRQPGR
jgi:hypothetical protein